MFIVGGIVLVWVLSAMRDCGARLFSRKRWREITELLYFSLLWSSCFSSFACIVTTSWVTKWHGVCKRSAPCSYWQKFSLEYLSVLTNGLAGKSDSKMIYFVSSKTLKLNWISHVSFELNAERKSKCNRLTPVYLNFCVQRSIDRCCKEISRPLFISALIRAGRWRSLASH